jgi:F-type H+-transporting ATPase subunit epsilon
MADTLKLEIITPLGIAVSEDVHMVTLPAIEGEMGVYPHHVRLITQLVPGEITITKDGQGRFLAVGEGLVEITPKGVAIATDTAIPSDQLDEAKIEEARKRAAARVAEKVSDEEMATVNASLVHALSQLQVKRRRRM